MCVYVRSFQMELNVCMCVCLRVCAMHIIVYYILTNGKLKWMSLEPNSGVKVRKRKFQKMPNSESVFVWVSEWEKERERERIISVCLSVRPSIYLSICSMPMWWWWWWIQTIMCIWIHIDGSVGSVIGYDDDDDDDDDANNKREKMHKFNNNKYYSQGREKNPIHFGTQYLRYSCWYYTVLSLQQRVLTELKLEKTIIFCQETLIPAA